jgi:hypothetical protein
MYCDDEKKKDGSLVEDTTALIPGTLLEALTLSDA